MKKQPSAGELAAKEVRKLAEALKRLDPETAKKLKRTGKQLEYYETIEKVIVTYHDGGTKEFDSDNWFIFEDKVRPIAKKIKIVEI